MDPLLVILDLDETLIHATETPLERAPDFVAQELHVYKRPGLDRFLAQCLDCYRVAVWSQSGSEYVHDMLKMILDDRERLEFVWCSERCTPVFSPETQQQYWVKDLGKVRRRGYSLERVIFVDDSAYKLERSYGNLVRIREFTGDAADRELEYLALYLENIAVEPNVRRIEKRAWRSRWAVDEG